jgi:hypothetical protein
MPARPPDDADNVAHEQEILDRYTVPDKDAPASTGGRLPSVAADRVGPGPLPAQGSTSGVSGPDGLTGGVRVDEAGQLVTDRGIPLSAAAAEKIMTQLRARYDLGAAANAETDETPVPAASKADTNPHFPGWRVVPTVAGKWSAHNPTTGEVAGNFATETEAWAAVRAAVARAGGAAGAAGAKAAGPGILAAALASVRKQVTSLSEITGRQEAAEFTEGTPGHSDELDEGEQPAPFNKSLGLPAQVSKLVSELRSVRKAVLPLAAAGQSAPARAVGTSQNPGTIGADRAHLAGRNLTGQQALEAVRKAQAEAVAGAEAGPLGARGQGGSAPTVRRDGGLAGHLLAQSADRLQLQSNAGGQVHTGGTGTGLTRQSNAGGTIGTGKARLADGYRSGGSGHHGGGRGK